jgi:hypothetical protein
MKTGDQFSMSYAEFVESPLHPLFVQAFERGWDNNKLCRAFDAANISSHEVGLENEVPVEMFMEAVLAGEFDSFLFEWHQSRN